jgi:hypothetical protein
MPRIVKPYKYKQRGIAPPDMDYGHVLTRTGSKEQLTGVVQGLKASDLEERVAKSLDKLEIPFDFRARITSDALGQRHLTSQFANIKGEVEIDMLCDRNGLVTPIFVDGEIGHHFTPYQAEQDKVKTDVTDEFGRAFGWKESVRIPFWKLIDQDMTDRTIRDIFV